MAAATNPYRRKQDIILGVDISNHTSRPTSQAGYGRHDTLSSTGRGIRGVGHIPAHISHIPKIPENRIPTPESDGDRDNEAARFMDIRRETEMIKGGEYHEPASLSSENEAHDPFKDEADEEDDEEYDSLEDELLLYGGSLARSRTVVGDRLGALRGITSSDRSSSVLGYRAGPQDRRGTALPSKAERMLGMVPKIRSSSAALAPRSKSSRAKKGGLASKAQRLLGVTAQTISDSQTKQQDRGMIDHAAGPGGMAMARAGAEVDDFRRLLLTGDKGAGLRIRQAESTSDTSSLSRSSMLESQTSRSSRELLSPESEIPTWTSVNAAPPPWIGVHPAFRESTFSKESDSFSTVSPLTTIRKDFMFAQHSTPVPATHPEGLLTVPFGPVELDAGPPSPVELPVPDMEFISRSLPSGPPGRAMTLPILKESAQEAKMEPRPGTEPADLPAPQKKERPSAIFENPNIFEMPGDVPTVSVPVQTPEVSLGSPFTTDLLSQFPNPPSPPPSGKSSKPFPARTSESQRSTTPPGSSPYPPPQRPLPLLPSTARPSSARSEKSASSLNPDVDFNDGRTRHYPDDFSPLPRTLPSQSNSQSRSTSPQAQPELASPTMEVAPLKATSVPSPLAMAMAEGKPITKVAPPPLYSSEDLPPSPTQRAAQANKRRVTLSDKDPSRAKAATKPKKPAEDDSDSIHRPFSWQSTKTANSVRTVDEDAPPMPPPLALQIPTDAVRKASSHLGAGSKQHSALTSTTPLTATSARSRASRLEKALEQALSKEGMEKALSGERIEDLFRSAGAEELFMGCPGGQNPKEGWLKGEEEEDPEAAKQAEQRAKDLLKDLSELQKEVDRLRRLYAEGGLTGGDGPF